MNHEQMEEWIREVEQRPSSAPLIIGYISRRLRDLTNRNEELLAENIELRSGRKVEEYEGKIANLEYQLDILKRQIGGTVLLQDTAHPAERLSIIIYNLKGQVLRIDAQKDELGASTTIANIRGISDIDHVPPRLLVTTPQEEILFVFDSGRVSARPVSSFSICQGETIEWDNGQLVEPRSGEELAAVLPIGMMTLFDYCIQVSRRGCVKRMMKTSFESHLANQFVGSGVKLKNDKTCCLTLSGKNEQISLVSKEGYVLTTDVDQLPYTTEEALRLSATDHIVTAFLAGQKTSVIFVTQNGKVIHREGEWLTKAESARSKGQAVFSQARRDAGVRIVGAAAVDENDWGMAITTEGEVFSCRVADLFASGAVDVVESRADLAAFTAFTL
jgi:DNA gyrase/topoisomerase IV subunit A